MATDAGGGGDGQAGGPGGRLPACLRAKTLVSEGGPVSLHFKRSLFTKVGRDVKLLATYLYTGKVQGGSLGPSFLARTLLADAVCARPSIPFVACAA